MSSIDTIYECTPRQVREYVLDCLYAGLVPIIQSPPGMGKSALVKSIFRQLNLFKIDHRASTSDPTDFNGLPGFSNGKAMFHPFEEIFPVEDTPIPDGYEGFGIFLDEFNSAAKMVQAACFKLALDKMVGQRKLHPLSVIVMAGNLDTDGGITTPLSTPMRSRLVHIRMRIDFQEWLEDVAYAEDYDHRIIGYLNYDRSKLMHPNPKESPVTFNCPRTWEFMNALIKGNPVLDSKIPLYAGTISTGVAVDFVQFTKVDLPKIEEIVADPHGKMIPSDKASRWAVVSMLAAHTDKNTFGPCATYVNRMGIEFRILFFRMALAKNPAIHGHPDMVQAMVELSKYTSNNQAPQLKVA